MASFLESVLDTFTDWKSEPERCVFILPSKRAGFFLKTLMAKKAGKTLLAPEILSVEDFVEGISGLRYASSTKLLFSLYEVFLQQDGTEKESFSDFSKWGQMLLQDFNELDRYLVDTEAFFKYLGSIQELKNWTLDGSSTPLIDKRVRFWKSLEPIYSRYRSQLEAEGLGYQGQVYRRAAGKAADYLAKRREKTYVFIGFNALNKAEEVIIRSFLDHGNAQIYWDADPYYLDNPIHDAGLFLRKHLKTWEYFSQNPPLGLSEHFSNPGRIEITGLPKDVSQAKFCGDLLQKIDREQPGALDHTAVVLGDENLLNPILHSLPNKLTSVNVTMGYPLKESPVAHLMNLLLDIFSTAGERGIAVRPLLKLLEHPFLQSRFREEGFNLTAASASLVRDNKVHLSRTDLEVLNLPKELRGLLSLSPPYSPRDLLLGFRELIGCLMALYREGKDKLPLEYLHRFHALFTQLFDLSEQYPFLTDLKSLRILYEQLLEEERIDFHGEPLQGLQIMGMLESRCLDFESVIITSVNEGILPAGKSNVSFIPFDVKREFGLPTHKEKDAIYTYHFYRLLQRAKKIYLCYNTEPDVLIGGEPSRFIQQLKTDPVISSNVHASLAAPLVGPIPQMSQEIPKDPKLLEVTKARVAKGLSPTSLSLFIEDPLVFYKKYLLGIPETDILEETVAANTFGTVIHETLEVLYTPFLGEILTPSHVDRMRKDAAAILKSSFQEHYLKGSSPRGKNHIALQVMNKYLEMFLSMEEKRIRQDRIRLMGVETSLQRELPVPGLDGPALLKGTVDRMEEVNDQLQIVDYKTGRVVPGDLRIKDWDTLHNDPKKAKAFQVLCYAWLLEENFGLPESGIRAGVYSFKNNSAGFQWFGLHTSGWKYNEAITASTTMEFSHTLESLVRAILNPEIPFAPVEN